FVGVFVDRRIGDVRDIGERRQRLAGSVFVTQVHRDDVKAPPARQGRLAPRNADDIPARRRKGLDSGNPDEAARACDQYLVLRSLGHLNSPIRQFQIAVMPPSTGRSTPAMKLASSEARNKAADAISSGRPSRPNGTEAANWTRAWSAPSLVGACCSKIGVSIG